VCQPTLSRWLREATRVARRNGEEKSNQPRARREPWSTADKLRILAAACALANGDLGAFLGQAGVHEATLRQWQEAAASALSAPKRRGRARQSPEAKRVVELERELRRKDAALAEMAALITLQKEARAIWGDEVDGTGTRSGT